MSLQNKLLVAGFGAILAAALAADEAGWALGFCLGAVSFMMSMLVIARFHR
jgi:hypothetical protein